MNRLFPPEPAKPMKMLTPVMETVKQLALCSLILGAHPIHEDRQAKSHSEYMVHAGWTPGIYLLCWKPTPETCTHQTNALMPNPSPIFATLLSGRKMGESLSF